LVVFSLTTKPAEEFMKNILLICLIGILSACKTAPQKNTMHKVPMGKDVFATAILESRSGSKAQAKASFTYTDEGIKVFIKAKNLSPGLHGVHIHENGDCSAEDGSSAGAHYNPSHKTHGVPNPLLHHVGDFGNIMADNNGVGILNLLIPRAHFYPDFDWHNIIGKSLIIHGGSDDLSSQPSGNSGNRIACGVIKAKHHNL
jgi:Cu-Zn family superoxide dismutase